MELFLHGSVNFCSCGLVYRKLNISMDRVLLFTCPVIYDHNKNDNSSHLFIAKKIKNRLSEPKFIIVNSNFYLD